MYKMLMFLKKDKDEKVYEHFRDFTSKYLSEMADKDIKIGKVESSLLLETKYSHFCELVTNSKEEMDDLLSTKKGKDFNNYLTDFHQNIDVIFIDFNKKD